MVPQQFQPIMRLVRLLSTQLNLGDKFTLASGPLTLPGNLHRLTFPTAAAVCPARAIPHVAYQGRQKGRPPTHRTPWFGPADLCFYLRPSYISHHSGVSFLSGFSFQVSAFLGVSAFSQNFFRRPPPALDRSVHRAAVAVEIGSFTREK
jgi:hypothetical protein